MSENNLREKTSDEVRLPASRKIYVETNGNSINQNKHNFALSKAKGRSANSAHIETRHSALFVNNSHYEHSLTPNSTVS